MNPCSGAHNAQDPSWFEDRGFRTGAILGPIGVYEDAKHGFHRGGVLDAQAQGRDPQTGQGGGERPYGNYTYGAYMSAAGVPLSLSLFAANKYAHDSNAQYGPDIPRDSTYGSLPQDNVAYITNGYLDQRNGVLCQK